jgi:hypothetical protein
MAARKVCEGGKSPDTRLSRYEYHVNHSGWCSNDRLQLRIIAKQRIGRIGIDGDPGECSPGRS